MVSNGGTILRKIPDSLFPMCSESSKFLQFLVVGDPYICCLVKLHKYPRMKSPG